jgi:type I restriction enzyme S subunit
MSNKLPKNWIYVKLGDVISKPQYGWTSKAGAVGNIKYLRTTDLSGGKVNWETVPYCIDEPDNIEKYQLENNDIVISRAGSVGLSFRLDNPPGKCVFASYLIRFKPKINVKYIEFFLKSQQYWKVINEVASGIAMQNINASKISDIEFPLAPLNEQERIADKLTKFYFHLDIIESKLDNLPTIIKQLRDSILLKAISGKLVEGKYPTKKIADLATFIGSGVTPKGGSEIYKQEGIPFIRSMNVYPEGIVWDGMAYVTEELHNKMKRTHVCDGDVLLNITGASIGRSTIVPVNFGQANVNQHVCILRFNKTVIPEYISMFFNSPIGQEIIMSSQSGMTRQGLNYTQIRDIEVQIPSFEIQQKVMLNVNKLFKVLENVEMQFNNLKLKFDRFPNSVLNKAYMGKLGEQNTKDESAEKLFNRLASIKEEISLVPKSTKAIGKTKGTSENKTLLNKINMDIIQIIKKEFGEKPFSYEDLQGRLNLNTRSQYIDVKKQIFELLRKEKLGVKNTHLLTVPNKADNTIQFKLIEK